MDTALRTGTTSPRLVIQRQLGHADLEITSRYLRGIDNTEIIVAVHERQAPMIPADPRISYLGLIPGPSRSHVAALRRRRIRESAQNASEHGAQSSVVPAI